MRREVLDVNETFRNDDYSLAHISLRGLNRAVRNERCTVTYKVRGGYGWMRVEDEMYELTEGVEITVLPGQRYQDVGWVDMEARSEPPFDQEQVRRALPLIRLSLDDQIALANLVGQDRAAASQLA